jgi:hypothetical protein
MTKETAMNWSVSDSADVELTQRIIGGDYLALKESVAQSNANIRDVKTETAETAGSLSEGIVGGKAQEGEQGTHR